MEIIQYSCKVKDQERREVIRKLVKKIAGITDKHGDEVLIDALKLLEEKIFKK